MARNPFKGPCNYKYDASSVGNKRRMNKRAKTGGNKGDRQRLRKDLDKRLGE